MSFYIQKYQGTIANYPGDLAEVERACFTDEMQTISPSDDYAQLENLKEVDCRRSDAPCSFTIFKYLEKFKLKLWLAPYPVINQINKIKSLTHLKISRHTCADLGSLQELSFEHLTSLKVLHLIKTSLTILPNGMDKLSELEDCRLQYNLFKEFTIYDTWQKLNTLDLSNNNRFTTLHFPTEETTSLTHLNLQGSFYVEISSLQICQFPNLKVFKTSQSKSIDLPASTDTLYLQCSNDFLSTNHTSLKKIVISNLAEAYYPKALASLKTVTVLKIARSADSAIWHTNFKDLNGLPEGFNQFTELTVLNLDGVENIDTTIIYFFQKLIKLNANNLNEPLNLNVLPSLEKATLNKMTLSETCETLKYLNVTGPFPTISDEKSTKEKEEFAEANRIMSLLPNLKFFGMTLAHQHSYVQIESVINAPSNLQKIELSQHYKDYFLKKATRKALKMNKKRHQTLVQIVSKKPNIFFN